MQDLGRISISNTVTVYLARAYYISMWGTIHLFFDLMINKILNWGYTGWSKKKFMMWSRGKVFEKFENIFWFSLSLYIFTSSQEVRAF